MNRALLISLVMMALSQSVNGQTKSDFCKKWNLKGYIYWGITLSPEETEINDFLNFNKNGTFNSIDRGMSEKGAWEWNIENNSLYLYDDKSKEPLIFKVIEVTETELILLLQDDDNSIKLKFSSAK